MESAQKDVAIRVTGLEKVFKLPTQKIGSVKSVFTGFKKLKNRSFEIQHALRGVDFEVQHGEFFGIVGRNGSGKSTLLKLIAGIYQPTKGTIGVNGKIVPFIELGVGFNPELSGRDNVYLNGAMLGFTDKQVDEKYQSIVDFAEIERFMDQKLKNYSSGMQVRLAFSVATILAESDILLLDEVLAVGDADFQRKCFNYFKQLKKLKKTVILVTHDMDVVREFCDRGILIKEGKTAFAGTAEELAREYLRLFDTTKTEKPKKVAVEKGTRWGDKAIAYQSATIKMTKETVKLTLVAKAKARVDDPVFGYLVKSSDDKSIMGSNSHIKKQKVKSLAPGETVKVSWEFPNIFGNGIHSIDVAVTQSDGATVHDWWESATTFSISGRDKTPYGVSPDTRLAISKPS
jgi:ABC-2 type transport system ATP-binding protein